MRDIVDFSECNFIEDRMKFYGYKDFFEHRNIIKRLFNTLSNNGKIFYKYYIYANTTINDNKYKNCIWDFLNDYTDVCHLAKVGRIKF